MLQRNAPCDGTISFMTQSAGFDQQLTSSVDAVSRFDPLDLARRVGALALMPANGSNSQRLELAANMVATLDPT